ncbi:MAG: ABC transporter ATP-binding protein [Ruminococcaceae bacterium]|nr:ABC transporter ATP-binding protein [Oscillospiraceae bacterium]
MKNKSSLKRVLLLIKPYGFMIFMSVLCSVISVAASLLIPIFSGKAIDYMIGDGQTVFGEILKFIIIIAVTVGAACLAQYFSSALNNRVTFKICNDIRNKVNEKLHKLPVSYTDSHRTGDLVSRVTADVDSFADGLLMGFTQLFTGVLTIVAALVIMLVLNWVIALTVIILTPASIFVAKFIASHTHKYFKQQSAIRGEQTALINELIEGQKTVKAFGHEEESIEDFDEVNKRLEKAALNATFYSSLVNPSTRLINNVVYAFVALIGAFFAITGGVGMAMTVGGLSVFLNYAGQYAKPFNEISGVITELQNAFTCIERIFELLDEKEIVETDTPVNPTVKGEVELKNVAFSYEPEKPLITDLNLDVKKGQRVAIVGPTGCGKTTLINLLMRFYDTDSGEIIVDGVEIKDMTRHNLRLRYGMVLQDTWLCHGTVKENISYGKPDASDEDIVTAAKAAHAHSFIKRLPQGYDTVIIGGGANLSAGQRQLICIARAMLSLPQMLILDEATSSIDTRTELKIQSAFAVMMKGRTSFIVAHRLSTIREADVILVMRDGQVIEQGNHDELLKKGGFYANLYNSQFD